MLLFTTVFSSPFGNSLFFTKHAVSYLTLRWLITTALWSPVFLTLCESVGAAEKGECLWLSWVCLHGRGPYTPNRSSSSCLMERCPLLVPACVLCKLTSIFFVLFLLALPRRCERLPRAHVCGKNKQRLGVYAPLWWRLCEEASRYSSEATYAVDGHSGQVNDLFYLGEQAKTRELSNTKFP